MMQKGNVLLWVIIAVVVLGGGYYLLKNKSSMYPAGPTQETSQPTAGPTSATMEKEKTVNVTADGFQPQTVTIKVGEKVVWVNKSGVESNVSSAVHPTHLVYPPLNLGSFADGASVSLVFDKAGTYKYHNHLNPSQFGSVVVE